MVRIVSRGNSSVETLCRGIITIITLPMREISRVKGNERGSTVPGTVSETKRGGVNEKERGREAKYL